MLRALVVLRTLVVLGLLVVLGMLVVLRTLATPPARYKALLRRKLRLRLVLLGLPVTVPLYEVWALLV